MKGLGRRLQCCVWCLLFSTGAHGHAVSSLRLYLEAAPSPFTSAFSRALLDESNTTGISYQFVNDVEQADVVLALGDSAFEAAGQHDLPYLGVYVSRALAQTARRKGCRCAAVWAGVALHDQLMMIETLMPTAKHVGVLLGANSAWSRGSVIDYQGAIRLSLFMVDSESSVNEELKRALRDVDAVLLPVDDGLFNASMARLILLTSYRQRRPVFGPDHAYVLAGSAATMYGDVGELAGETQVHLEQFRQHKRFRRSGFVHTPSVFVNDHVAHSFGLRFTDADRLDHALEVAP